MNARETGSILDGKYEIVNRLGSGGMGEVYLVRHLHLQELRVVKILRQDLAGDTSAQKRFMREARLATQVKHPNVAILYDFATLHDGSFYMVWEHIQGQNIGDRIQRSGPFSVPVAVELGIQALQGLEAIHSTGVLHRDLSPDNLMITEDKTGRLRIKIIDLGLARTLEADANFEITQVGMFMGKLQYCSPEQAGIPSGVALDHRSDIYSFGLVLYEMIAGLPPFDSENQHGFIFKRLSEDPLPLRGRNPHIDVPQELDRVVRRALQRDREQRYPETRDFIGALEKVAKALDGAETREIPLAVLEASSVRSPPPRPRSSGELSRAERIGLLAQIDRASKRVQENTVDLSRAEEAMTAGRLDEAQRLIGEIAASHPRALGLDRLQERLAEARHQRTRREAETEQVLANYLQRKQLPLARLALETLLEIQPESPRRAEFEARLKDLAEETERGKRAEVALIAGRNALANGDLKAARRELEAVTLNDPEGKRAEALKREIEGAERQSQQTVEIERRRRRFEELLAAHRLVEAKEELDALGKLDVSRVTLDFYREQLQEARAGVQTEEQTAVFERRYRQALADHNWFAAREVAEEWSKAQPASPRAAAMYAEVERLETVHRRQQALEQGVRQVETFIEQGDTAKAELALKILLQMDPENRHRKRLEKQVAGLKK
ncbi:MAG TPA: protein kinase [Thermoanaerobaculia bacterium]|nr:protein kinase [Thermoanaerobaculia bacterium]